MNNLNNELPRGRACEVPNIILSIISVMEAGIRITDKVDEQY